jgi:O-antigen ligase
MCSGNTQFVIGLQSLLRPVFRAWTLSTIALTVASYCSVVFLTLMSRQKIVVRKVKYSSSLWIGLLAILFVATVLSPKDPMQAASPAESFAISVYRMSEWIIAFVLILWVYSREHPSSSGSLLVKMIATVCCANIACVWLVLPISPALAYSGTNDVTGAIQPRLGGFMVTPSHLGLMCGIAIFYFALFWRGLPRIFACLFLFGSLFLTYARGPLIGFLLVALFYLVFHLKNAAIRTTCVVGLCTVGGVMLTFSDLIVQYLARGNGTANITTLSERTMVWHAAFKAFQERPFIGYGYVQGVKAALAEYWTYKHWIPPHCHNDLIQALVSGGLIAGLCLLLIYIRVMWQAFKVAKSDPEHLFFLLALLQLCVYSILGPLLSAQYSQIGAIFILCSVGVLNGVPILAAPRRVMVMQPALVEVEG